MLPCLVVSGPAAERGRAGGREERAQAELVAHNQLVTQLTLLHHQVRSQNIVQPGYFVPRNVLADAYYTPVRCGPVPFAWQRQTWQVKAQQLAVCCPVHYTVTPSAKCFTACTRVCAYPAPPLFQVGRRLPGMGTCTAQAWR